MGQLKTKKDKLKFIILTPKDRTKVGTSKLITRMKSTLQMRRTYSSTTSHGASRCTTTSTILHVYSHLFVCPMHNFVLDKIQQKKDHFGLTNMFCCDIQPTVRAAGAVRDAHRPQLDRDTQEEGHVHVGALTL
jgi:hypothetical protein